MSGSRKPDAQHDGTVAKPGCDIAGQQDLPPLRPVCPICQTPLARDRPNQTMRPDNPDDVTEKEFDLWVCTEDRSHEPELHITDV